MERKGKERKGIEQKVKPAFQPFDSQRFVLWIKERGVIRLAYLAGALQSF